MSTSSSSLPFIQFSIRTLLIMTVVGAFFGLLMRVFGTAPILPWALFFLLVCFLTVLGKWLAFGVTHAAQNDPTRPVTIATFNDNFMAETLVSQLAENGIKAKTVGGFVSGFQAESPGYVDVVVTGTDYEPAKELIAGWNHEIEVVNG